MGSERIPDAKMQIVTTYSPGSSSSCGIAPRWKPCPKWAILPNIWRVRISPCSWSAGKTPPGTISIWGKPPPFCSLRLPIWALARVSQPFIDPMRPDNCSASRRIARLTARFHSAILRRISNRSSSAGAGQLTNSPIGKNGKASPLPNSSLKRKWRRKRRRRMANFRRFRFYVDVSH